MFEKITTFFKETLKGWRTRVVALAHILIGAVAEIVPNTLQMVVSDTALTRRIGWILIGQGVLIYYLRQITTTPPGKRY